MTDLRREQAFVAAVVGTMRVAPLARRIPRESLEYLATLVAADAQCAHRIARDGEEQHQALTTMRHGLQLAARACCLRLGLLRVTQVEPIPRGEDGEDVQVAEWFGLSFPALMAQAADLDPEDEEAGSDDV